MSIQAVAWAINAQVGDSILKLLLISIANYADEDGRAYPSLDRLSRDAEVSKRTIQRKLEDLQAAGFIRILPRARADGGRSSNLYELVRSQTTPHGQSVHPPMDIAVSTPHGHSCVHPPMDTKESTPNEPSVINRHLTNDSSPDDWPVDFLDRFWQAYPPYRRTAKKTVAQKLASLRARREVTFAELMAGLARYCATNPGEFAKAPVVWINGGCWMDEHGGRNGGSTNTQPRASSAGNPYARLGAEVRARQRAQGEDELFPDEPSARGRATH